MNIYLSSGISSNYLPRATGYLESVKKHFPADGPVRPLMFAVDYAAHVRDLLGVPCVPICENQIRLQLPKKMLQNGLFTDFAPSDWKDDDVVIFTDADAYFQRPFTEAEIAAFAAVKPGEFLGDYNCPNHWQSLLSEAADLFPKCSMAAIENAFPGMEKLETKNWGFIVARLDSWRELNRRTIASWPRVDASFGNPARVQLACIWEASQPGLSIGRLPVGIHLQAHHGIQKGAEKGSDGLWRLNGEVCAFAHAI